jgi:hypothetical protein
MKEAAESEGRSMELRELTTSEENYLDMKEAA